MAYQSSIKQKAIRRLLQLDQPVKVLTATEAEAERDRNFSWNLFFNAFDVIFFMGGIGLLSATTIIPLFISKLTDSVVPLAIVAMLAQGGFFLPQLFVANFTERLDYKKPMVVNLGFLTERIPALLLFLTALAVWWSPFLALISFLLFYTWFNLGGGVIAPAWQDMIARCFPVTRRGRFFGSTMFIGTLLAVVGTSFAGTILTQVAFPVNFAYIFGAAGLSIMISWIFVAQTREPIEAANVPTVSTRQYFAALPNLLRSDINFRNFLIVRFIMALSEMGSGFLTVAAIQTWAISDSLVATFTTVTLIGQTTGSLLLGFISDRYGHRLSLEIVSLSGVLAFALAWIAPTPSWYIAVFGLLGFYTGGRIVSGLLVVLEFCVAEKRPTYIGITSTLAGVGSMIAPLIGAGFVLLGYSWVFVGSLVTSLISLLLLRYWVKEPRLIETPSYRQG
ncbi:MAG: MFS transporter [Chloroflexota bacterium]